MVVFGYATFDFAGALTKTTFAFVFIACGIEGVFAIGFACTITVNGRALFGASYAGFTSVASDGGFPSTGCRAGRDGAIGVVTFGVASCASHTCVVRHIANFALGVACAVCICFTFDTDCRVGGGVARADQTISTFGR